MVLSVLVRRALARALFRLVVVGRVGALVGLPGVAAVVSRWAVGVEVVAVVEDVAAAAAAEVVDAEVEVVEGADVSLSKGGRRSVMCSFSSFVIR